MDLKDNKELNNAFTKLKKADETARKSSGKPMNYSNLITTKDDETDQHFALNRSVIEGDKRKAYLNLTLRNICDSAILCSSGFSDDLKLKSLIETIDRQEDTEYSVTLNLTTKNNKPSDEVLQLNKQDYKDLVSALYISNFLNTPPTPKELNIIKHKITELFTSGNGGAVARCKQQLREAISQNQLPVSAQIEQLMKLKASKKAIV